MWKWVFDIRTLKHLIIKGGLILACIGILFYYYRLSKNQGITLEVICNKETTKSKKYSHLLLLLLRLIMGIIPR